MQIQNNLRLNLMVDKFIRNIEMEQIGDLNGLVVTYASDDGFAHVMGVSLISLFENNQEANEIIVFILDDQISTANKRKIISIFNKYGRKYWFIDVVQLNVPNTVISNRWSKSAFTRLYMSNLLPKNVSRVLYLDCDTVINRSLIDLWSINMHHKVFAGVSDCLSDGYKINLGMSIDSPYINSGVLLINLNEFRKSNCEAKISEFMQQYSKVISYPDQDVINGIFEGNIVILEPVYDSMTIFYDFTYKDMLKYRKPNFYYTKEQIEVAVTDPYIIHYTSCFLSVRPWMKDSKHPQLNKYLKYKKLSPWSDKELTKDNRGLITKAYSKLFRMLPSTFSVGISGWLHASLLPWFRARRI